MTLSALRLRPLSFADFDRLRPLFERQNRGLAAYSLHSILAWSSNEFTPVGEVADGALLHGVEFHTKKENRHLLLPVSPDRGFGPEDLRNVAEAAGFGQYWYVPEGAIEAFGRKEVERRFDLEEQSWLSDYVYETRDLASLDGRKYAKKRNLVRQFERSHLEKGAASVEAITGANADECVEFLEEWCLKRDCDKDVRGDLACEKQACINTLGHIETPGLRSLLLRIEGKVRAFAVSSRVTADMGTLQFEKADESVKGLYQYFDRECARRLFEGMRYINKESDMGVPGLRKAKQSYHPVSRVRSYRLALR